MTSPSHATIATRAPRGRRRRRARPLAAAGLAGLLAGAFVVGGPGIGSTEASTVAGGYALSRLNDGSPATWAACRSLTWGLATDGAGPGATSDVHHAIRLAAAVTGLRFVYVDAAPPAPQRSWLAPGGWPASAPDLVVAWAVPPSEQGRERPRSHAPVSDLLTGSGEAAVGGWSAEYRTPSGGGRARGHIHHGYVVLDALADARFAPSFHHPDSGLAAARRPLRGRLLLHELGHALGLAHVDDDKQVMHPEIGSGEAAWGLGDRAGLRTAQGGTVCGR